MRALAYISLILLLILGSCSSSQYSGSEYDDLYYSSSDKPATQVQSSANKQPAEQNLSVNDYYDNMYAVDTLVSDQFNDAAQYDDQIIVNNNYGSGYGGYDYYDYSYSGRLNMFYGNYFNPYWQDPYYFNVGYGYPYGGMSFGFGFGYPYFSFGFNYGYPYYPYYGYGGYYGGYYPPYYGGYYPPYYCCGYYPGYGYDDYYVDYGRRERTSTMSSRTGNDISAQGGYSRRDGSLSSRAGGSGGSRSYSGAQSGLTSARRTDPSSGTTGVSKSALPARSTSQEAVKGTSARSNTSSQQGSSAARPEYKNSNRTYTPSYNNPRMSTRPSYNNSRTIGSSEYAGRFNSSSYNRTPSGSSSGNAVKSAPSGSGGQRLPAYRPGNSVQYSTPGKRSSDGGSSGSSGSYSRSSSGYSSPSRSSGSSGYSG